LQSQSIQQRSRAQHGCVFVGAPRLGVTFCNADLRRSNLASAFERVPSSAMALAFLLAALGSATRSLALSTVSLFAATVVMVAVAQPAMPATDCWLAKFNSVTLNQSALEC
jgi:hypothetical protein